MQAIKNKHKLLKDKRGEEEGFSWTAGQIAKIILAVVGIVLLLILAKELGLLFLSKTEVEQARELSTNLEKEIQSIASLQKTNTELVVESPKYWAIVSWPGATQYNAKYVLPSKCGAPKEDGTPVFCTCICEGSKGDTRIDTDAGENCLRDNSFCFRTEKEVVLYEKSSSTPFNKPIVIDKILNLKIYIVPGLDEIGISEEIPTKN